MWAVPLLNVLRLFLNFLFTLNVFIFLKFIIFGSLRIFLEQLINFQIFNIDFYILINAFILAVKKIKFLIFHRIIFNLFFREIIGKYFSVPCPSIFVVSLWQFLFLKTSINTFQICLGVPKFYTAYNIIWFWIQIVKVTGGILGHRHGRSVSLLPGSSGILDINPFIEVLVFLSVHVRGRSLHNYLFIFKGSFIINCAFFKFLLNELDFFIDFRINNIFASKKSRVSFLLIHVWNSIFSCDLIAFSIVKISSQAIGLWTDHKISELQLIMFVVFINNFLAFLILVLVGNAGTGRRKFPEICIFNILTRLLILLILRLLHRAAITCFLHTWRWLKTVTENTLLILHELIKHSFRIFLTRIFFITFFPFIYFLEFSLRHFLCGIFGRLSVDLIYILFALLRVFQEHYGWFAIVIQSLFSHFQVSLLTHVK